VVTKSKTAVTKGPNRVAKLTSDPMQRIVESARQGKLVVVVGAGVSMSLTNGVIPSWSGLIKNGFDYAKRKGRISEAQLTAWSSQLASTDMDELLGAAEFMGRKLGAPGDQIYGRWLEEVFSSVQPSNQRLSIALKTLVALGIPLCTLNYDPLLERVTGLPALQVSETKKVMSWIQREHPAILHLHGSWDTPSSCILGIRDYETTQTNEVRDLFQRNLAVFNHLLFIGCGDTLADPNFSALIKWLRTKLQALTPQHIALTREDEVAGRNADPAWSGFVEPLSYGDAHDDLAEFLLKHFPLTTSKKPTKKMVSVSSESNIVLERYRYFLLRDCGQMTIEGVSADMDTGQRKFDLERLFVPLDVSACPPEFSPSDPDSAAKLEKWNKENKGVMPFGKVLAGHKRLALLALPGGGKTLLLKRLAVAYAEPSRRSASTDELPDLKLLPVLIRCREWRDHIRLPIKTLLKNIGDITGQSNLAGLSDALVPILKKGHVLLLVDGLDEIHNDADRTTFVEHLESFLEEYRHIRIVITSREAGFNLVAPSLARFCERWRLAPLAEDAISLLCGYWHRLMTGDTPAAIAEGQEVAQILLRNDSLRRLAENPLLLTMLLVVKHGAGGLPPDRVSLYGRAVDVLLDTWNIKGHDPLNAKEAVPQLAYVAFQLMCMGKQTATENELLALLEEARERHPNIRRYARDSPHNFLKRVELRSSLLLEAGHQMEDGRTVPFYQFRHLTFQEYLTAVAATEGHYKQYQQDDTVLTPLASYLLAEEWKEVIPMVAVLARKRAEPLLVELISKGNSLRSKVETGDSVEENIVAGDKKLPGPAGRLVQCFIEEAEASPETLSSALQLIAFFAHGCKSGDDWEALCRGPYGRELYNQAWELLISKQWPKESWLMNNCAGIAEYQKPFGYWAGEQGKGEVSSLLQSAIDEEIGRGLLICMGMLWNHSRTKREDDAIIAEVIPIDLVEPHLFHPHGVIWSIATWVWINTRRRLKSPSQVTVALLDKFLLNWLKDSDCREGALAAFALSCQIGIDRDFWTPKLTKAKALKVRERFGASGNLESREARYENYDKSACFFVAYHAKTVWSDQELVSLVDPVEKLHHRLGFDVRWDGIRTVLGMKSPGKKMAKKG
jgi:hypothetical protein